MKVYEQLGDDIPHKSVNTAIKEDAREERPVHPMNMTEVTGETTVNDERECGVNPMHVENTDGQIPISTPDPPPSMSGKTKANVRKSGRRSKVRSKAKCNTEKPYEGLFDANLRLNEGPTVWVITDLREHIQGGDRTWTEPVECLICGTTVD